MNRPNFSWPNLNWKEIELLAGQIAPELEGLFVDRVIVPTRPRFPQGYLKGEWVIRFTGRKQERALLISLRARHPYFALLADKGPNAASTATRSPFDLALSKQLKDLKLVKFHVLPRERVVLLDFQQSLRLVLFLIPSTPEALLVQTQPLDTRSWSVIIRSRTIRDNPEAAANFEVPDGSRAPDNLPVRAELTQSPSLLKNLDSWLSQEAFTLRIQALEKSLREKSKVTRDRIRQSEVALNEGSQEPDWQRYADLLKSGMGTIPEAAAKEHEVLDYETGEKVKIPSDPRLSLREQVEKFYQHSRRKQRRVSEARNRIAMFTESRTKQESVETQLKSLNTEQPDWKALEQLERTLGVGIQQTQKNPELAKRKSGGWLGKSFESKEGLMIWVGRNRDENLELTFKHARGNDLWMHVRGRPGAHVVIPIQPGKSAPLEALLDAANLVVYYSGGENWGKTEVDYTYKKYVKRIKDSTEASYTNNKTLIVEPDRARLKRLLGTEEK
jgi:predicted ribosome quality control (RQC) complex YloA/Tae2 family protein